jgi:hypothetical protein
MINIFKRLRVLRAQRKREAEIDVFRETFKGVLFMIMESQSNGDECTAATLAMEYFGRRYWQVMLGVVKIVEG